jgi:hypothetical protein
MSHIDIYGYKNEVDMNYQGQKKNKITPFLVILEPAKLKGKKKGHAYEEKVTR